MKHVLIVDDVAEIRRLVRLATGRHHVHESASTGHALQLIKELPAIDLIILDIMLPGPMDGLQLLSVIRSDPKLANTKVVMLTARGAAEDQARSAQLGANAYYTKPFSPMELNDCIEELLHDDFGQTTGSIPIYD